MQIPEGHVAYCLLVPEEVVPTIRAMLGRARVPVAEDTVHPDPTVVFPTERDIDVPDVEVSVELPSVDDDYETFLKAGGAVLDWAEAHDGRAAVLELVSLTARRMEDPPAAERWVSIEFVKFVERLGLAAVVANG